MQSTALNWWASSEVQLPSTVCPASPSGELQTLGASVAATDWSALSNYASLGTLILVLLAVWLTYRTSAMGAQFARRWWFAFVLTALAALPLSFVIVMWPQVSTFGCQFGTSTVHVPFVAALERSTVSFVQSLILFLVGSFLLTRIVRVGRWQPYFNNSRYPI